MTGGGETVSGHDPACPDCHGSGTYYAPRLGWLICPCEAPEKEDNDG